MDQPYAVVYVAQSSQQAHLLKDLLIDGGIQADVINEALDGGSGAFGSQWDTAARVIVPRKDADLARRVALYFDHHVEEISASMEQGEGDFWAEIDAAELPDDWPACPGCGSRRTAVCPICHTAGSDFPLADHELVANTSGETGEEGPAPGCGSCGGGPGTCSPDANRQPTSANAGSETSTPEGEPGEPDREDDLEAAPAERLVLCTTCDEPFVPRFVRRCPECGFEFDDGVEDDFHAPDESAQGEFNTRVLVALLLLAGLAVGGFVYMLSVLPSK